MGSQFIEVVAPNDPAEDTAGKRYLDRRGGDGGYMVITQCDDQAPRRAKFKELGVRLVSDHAGRTFVNNADAPQEHRRLVLRDRPDDRPRSGRP